MIVSFCYIIISLITAFVLLFSFRIIKVTSSLMLVVPILVIYFWSIYGAWDYIPMKLRGESVYYEDMLFTVDLDVYYLETLFLYSVFLFIFSFYMFRIALKYGAGTRNKWRQRQSYMQYIEYLNSSVKYHLVIYTFLLFFLYFSIKDISAASLAGVSTYAASRHDSVLGNYRMLVSFCGDTFLFLSLPLLFCKKAWRKKMMIVVPILIYFVINLLLGNRHALLCGFCASIILSNELYGLKETIKPKIIVIFVLALAGIQVISFVRGLTMDALLSGGLDFDFLEVLESTGKSNEKYAAHLSMYGVLKKDVPITFGYSFYVLLFSIIPSFIAERPDDIYTYYINNTTSGFVDIGVTIHHATAWYLNLGLLGIVIGAALWGKITEVLYKRKNRFIFLYGCIIFSAVSIQLIRTGIEGYKGVILLDLIIPMFIVNYCLRNYKENERTIDIK